MNGCMAETICGWLRNLVRQVAHVDQISLVKTTLTNVHYELSYFRP
jgi:hypothetical protein